MVSTTVVPPSVASVNWIAAQFRLAKKAKKQATLTPLGVEGLRKTMEDLFAKHDVRLKKMDEYLDEINNDIMNAMSDLEYVSVLSTRFKTFQTEFSKKIDGVRNCEIRMKDLIDETRTTTLTVMYDVVNDLDAKHTKFAAEAEEEFEEIAKQATMLDDNMNTFKEVVQQALDHITNGEVKIEINEVSGSDTDNEPAPKRKRKGKGKHNKG